MAKKTIIVDAMSGDNAPVAQIHGALQGGVTHDVKIVFVGKEDVIKNTIFDYQGSIPEYEIIHADSVLTMDDAPGSVMSEKSDSSLAVAVKALKEGKGDALVSSANTGALFTASSLILRRLKGVRRAALGAVIPLEKRFLLLDSGANLDVTPEQLLQFAKMGEVYAKVVMKRENPTIGLLNNGSEEMKGTPLQIETYKLLKESNLNFVGNVEGDRLGKCDVVIADGYSGNIALKTIEGVAKFSLGEMKNIFSGFGGAIAYLLVKKKVLKLKKKIKPAESGGAPFLGISMPVIKAHGGADSYAFMIAIGQAKDYIDALKIMKESEF